jgi:hypothetical protein
MFGTALYTEYFKSKFIADEAFNIKAKLHRQGYKFVDIIPA